MDDTQDLVIPPFDIPYGDVNNVASTSVITAKKIAQASSTSSHTNREITTKPYSDLNKHSETELIGILFSRSGSAVMVANSYVEGRPRVDEFLHFYAQLF